MFHSKFTKEIAALIVSLSQPILAKSAEPMSAKEFCQRLEVVVDVYVYDQSGEQLLAKMSETRKYRVGNYEILQATDNHACKIRNAWGSISTLFEEPLYLFHEWKVTKEGKLLAQIQQFKSEEIDKTGKERFSELLDEKNLTIKDMAPIVWQSPLHKSKRVIVRFMPQLSSNAAAVDLTKLPLSGDDMVIVDNVGKLWASHITAEGVYIGMSTTEGTLGLSYYPFKGSKLLGSAKGQTIELNLPNQRNIFIHSKSPFLPNGAHANIYGLFLPEIKSKSLNSQSVHTTEEENRFLEKLKMQK